MLTFKVWYQQQFMLKFFIYTFTELDELERSLLCTVWLTTQSQAPTRVVTASTILHDGRNKVVFPDVMIEMHA